MARNRVDGKRVVADQKPRRDGMALSRAAARRIGAASERIELDRKAETFEATLGCGVMVHI